MYSINLYPEFIERRNTARLRVVKTGILAAFSGVVVLAIGSLIMSAFLINDRVASLSEIVSHQTNLIQNQSALEHELVSAREMLEIRSKRIDWAPKLAMLSEMLTEDLQIVEFEGAIERGKTKKKLAIIGETGDEDVQISVFTGFVDMLRMDPRLSNDFSSLRLGSVGGGSGTRFQILGDDSEGGS